MVSLPTKRQTHMQQLHKQLHNKRLVTMKWKDIVKNAEKVKKEVEKNKKIPKITGYNLAQLCYIFGEAVRNPNHDVTDIKVANAPNPTGSGINKNLTRNEYQKLAKYTNDWINDRKVAPNYTTYQNYMVSIRLQTYCYAKIIVYYDEHSNTLPITCWFKNSVFSSTASSTSTSNKTSSTPTSSNKKYGHATKSGCDNMGQNTGYYCACHSLQEVIRNLYGIVIPQSTLARVMGTTTAGTGHWGIETAVAWFNRSYGKNLKISWKNFSDLGWNGIKNIVDSNNQDCIVHNLYRNQWGHYEVLNNVSSNINVQNSLGSFCANGCYCGYIEYRTQGEFKNYINGISQKSIAVLTRG